MSDDQYSRLAGIIERIEFRDWRWILGVDGERCYLQVEFYAPDATAERIISGAEPIPQRGRKWLLSPHMTKSEVVSTAFAAVQMAVEHEAREDFRYRGEAVFGPHFDVENLCVLAATGCVDVREQAA